MVSKRDLKLPKPILGSLEPTRAQTDPKAPQGFIFHDPPPRLREWRAKGVFFVCFLFTVGMFAVGIFTVGLVLFVLKAPHHHHTSAQ